METPIYVYLAEIYGENVPNDNLNRPNTKKEQ